MEQNSSTPQTVSNQQPLKPNPASNILTVILVVLAFILVITTTFFGYQNYLLKSKTGGVAKYTPTPDASATPLLSTYSPITPSPSASASVSPTPTARLTVTTPLPNSTVTSPLTVAGTAPAGWMFEGQLGLKLLDSKKALIVQGVGNEKLAGSWQSGKPAEFSGSLVFSTADTSGFLVIEADNPSGLPENAKSFEIPVKF